MHFDRSEPGTANDFQAASAELILDSHLRLLQRPLLPDSPGMAIARRLYHASFVVLAHDGTRDPVFFYANLCAQQLFEMSWQNMVSLPSRLSAEPLAQAERRRLLDRVSQHGWIDDYSGVRVAASGRRFRIAAATVWNLLDETGTAVGQAAAFARWQRLD
jgi:hypothetical protein